MEISRNHSIKLTWISRTIKEVSDGIQQVNASVQELSSTVNYLEEMASKF